MESLVEQRLRQEAMMEVLLAGNLGFISRKGDTVAEDLRLTLGTIQEFISVSYRLGYNPLDHLRKHLWRFEWGYFKSKSVPKLLKLIKRNDYTLCGSMVEDWEDGIVTIVRKDLSTGWSRAYYYTDENHLSFPEELKKDSRLKMIRARSRV